MKKMMVALLAGAMLTLTAGLASAVSITYEKSILGNEFRSIYDGQVGFQTETFENATVGQVAPAITGLLWNWDINATIKQGDQSQNAAPFGVSADDATKYISVPNPNQSGTSTVTNLGADYNYFGLWWGSKDSYNSLSFFNDNVLVYSVTGNALPTPSLANGNQGAPSDNLFVNFRDFGVFDSFAMTSGNYAFEVDNITVGNVVPEPGTMMLLGIGLGGLAIFGKRRMNKEA